MERFIGTAERQIDAKGRLALPVEMRRALGDECYLVRGVSHCANIIRPAEFDRRVEVLELQVDRGERELDELRALTHAASFQTLDKQGRLTLDERLRAWIGIDTESSVIVAGTGRVIEIWSPERHAEIESYGSSFYAGSR